MECIGFAYACTMCKSRPFCIGFAKKGNVNFQNFTLSPTIYRTGYTGAAIRAMVKGDTEHEP